MAMLPIGEVIVEIGEEIVVDLIEKGGEWVIEKAWNAATKKPVLNFDRPPRIYDEKSGFNFILQPNGRYQAQGPRQI